MLVMPASTNSAFTLCGVLCYTGRIQDLTKFSRQLNGDGALTIVKLLEVGLQVWRLS